MATNKIQIKELMDELENGSKAQSANSENPEIKKQIDDSRCLEHEAVVTRAGAGDASLHVAAGRGGVHSTIESGDTPLYVEEGGHKESIEKYDVLPGKDQSRLSLFSHRTVNKDFQNNVPQELKYSKKDATSGVCGQLYETKLLSLLLIRLLNDEQIEDFLLGSNVNGIGAWDDICLRYKVKGQDRPVVLFIQAKHKVDREKKKLSLKDLQSAFGDFSLLRYLRSYHRIIRWFQLQTKLNSLFDGNFDDVDCYFIIYTPLKDNFIKKKTKPQLNEKVHYLINTGKKSSGFQCVYDYNHLFYLNQTFTKFLEDLVAIFFKLFMTERDKTQMLANYDIGRNHLVMAQEVIQPCKIQKVTGTYRIWQFRPSFFESDLIYLTTLKHIFIRKFSTAGWDNSEITNKDLDNCWALLQNPCASTVSKIIGKLVIYNYIENRLNLIHISLLRKKLLIDKFKELQKRLRAIVIHETAINEAVQIRLTTLDIKLPMAFGNIDMTFRGSEAKKLRRMKALADQLFRLFENNKTTKIVNISNDMIGKKIRKGIIRINGGLASAVGNLLVLDTETDMLKFDLDNKALPENASLFLKELKSERHKPFNEELSSFRIQIIISIFPKFTFPANRYHENHVKMFLNKLWFYTNQAQEDEIERILKTHINTYYNFEKDPNNPLFEIHSNAIFLKCHEKLQRWWMEKGETSYLSRANDIFADAKLECINTFLHAVIGNMPYFNISSIDFKFDQSIHQNRSVMEAREALNKIFSKLFDISDIQNKSMRIKMKEEIMALQQTSETSATNNVYHSSISQNISRIVNLGFRYFKRKGTSEMSGQLYRTKLLCLVYMRALNDKSIETFLLGSNIHALDDMDDICLRFRVRGQNRPVVLFVQVKHRDNPEKKRLTVEKVQSTSGDFSLWKYFESYLTIKARFRADDKDPMFEGAFNDAECTIVLYTPLMERFTEKKTKGQLSKKVHDLINTGQNSEVFQYDYKEAYIDHFTEITVVQQFKKLGILLLESITKNPEVMLINKLIARYHVVIAREVLQQCQEQKNKEYCTWKFRPEFFESDCNYLSALKEVLFEELQTKRYDKSNITNEDLDNWQAVLQDPCAYTVSKIIGKLATYNNKTKRLQLKLEHSAFKGRLKEVEFESLLKRSSEISFYEDLINEATRIKLSALEIKLPVAFGNLDMKFRGTEQGILRRIKAVSDKLIELLNDNINTKIVDINYNIVGPGRSIEKGILGINGGIGSAVGNLLIADNDTKMLKFDLDNKALPHNAALFLKQLKEPRYMPVNEKLDEYRFKINIQEFPKASFHANEFDKELAKDFLNKLWFFTNQAKENEVDRYMKDEIYKYYNIEFNQDYNILYENVSNHVFLEVHAEIQKWWMQVGESHYLSHESKILDRAERALTDNLLQTVINSMHVSRIYSMNINIKERITDYSKFVQMQQTFNSMSSRLFQMFDSKFVESIDITLPADFERCFEDLGCPAVEFSLEIHPETEWVTFKLMAKWSESNSYFVIATAGRGSGCGRPRDGFLLRQDFNGRSNNFLNGEKDSLDLHRLAIL